MNTIALFTTLENFETEVSRLYGRFAEVFATDNEAAIVFYRMHLEEKSHASLVRYQKRIAKQNPKLVRPAEVNVEILETTIKVVRSIRDSPVTPDLKSAVVRSYEIEMSAAESHYRNAIEHSCDGITHLLNGLCLGDKQHAVALREFGVGRGFLPNLSAPLPPSVSSAAVTQVMTKNQGLKMSLARKTILGNPA